jgi:ADP-heptose:LPS heptosyltransferase
MAIDPWNPPPERIAVFRALQLGDMLCAVPALRALRAHAPQARITLVGLPWAQSFVERFQAYVDDLLPFPGYPGYPEQEGTIPGFLDFLNAARAKRFDLAIQLHGSGELTNRIVKLLEARTTVGFVSERPGASRAARNRDADPDIAVPWPEDANEIHRYTRLMEAIGVAAQGDHLELPLDWTDWELYQEVVSRHRLPEGHFVCIHPGARLLSRRWPLERFAAVGNVLARDGWQLVVTGSPAESRITSDLVARLPKGTHDLTGQTSLGSMAALISRSALLVCNDTGVSHIAVAMNAPSVVVASGSDVRRWRPLDAERHPVLWHDVPCRPCAFDACPVGHHCALGVQADAVIAEARRLLSTRDIRHAA